MVVDGHPKKKTATHSRGDSISLIFVQNSFWGRAVTLRYCFPHARLSETRTLRSIQLSRAITQLKSEKRKRWLNHHQWTYQRGIVLRKPLVWTLFDTIANDSNPLSSVVDYKTIDLLTDFQLIQNQSITYVTSSFLLVKVSPKLW